MKKPYPLVPSTPVEIPHGETVVIYSDEVFTLKATSTPTDILNNTYYEFKYIFEFGEAYLPTDSTRLYAISNQTNTKFTTDFIEKDGVYSLDLCTTFSMATDSLQPMAENYTIKWVVGDKIYSFSFGIQYDVWYFTSESITLKTHCSGHINGTATVGENPFEGEGV